VDPRTQWPIKQPQGWAPGMAIKAHSCNSRLPCGWSKEASCWAPHEPQRAVSSPALHPAVAQGHGTVRSAEATWQKRPFAKGSLAARDCTRCPPGRRSNR